MNNSIIIVLQSNDGRTLADSLIMDKIVQGMSWYLSLSSHATATVNVVIIYDSTGNYEFGEVLSVSGDGQIIWLLEDGY